MREKDKAKLGELYNPNYDEELIRERTAMQDLCYEYNQLLPSKLEERKSVLKKILGSYSENFLIEQPFYCDYGYNIKIGERFYSNHGLTILDGAEVTFGNDVFIGPNCGFYTASHPFEVELRNQGLETAHSIVVGDNVWFGGNVVVLPGVTIGSDVVIGAGSIVTRDIPSHSVAVGNPARVIRKKN